MTINNKFLSLSCVFLLSSCTKTASNVIVEHRNEELKETLRYVVQSGDTLSEISQRYNLNWKNVALNNSLSEPYNLQVGQTIYLVPKNLNHLSSNKTAIASSNNSNKEINNITKNDKTTVSTLRENALKEEAKKTASLIALAKENKAKEEQAKIEQKISQEATQIAKEEITTNTNTANDKQNEKVIASASPKIQWIWPAKGNLSSKFTGKGSAKGIDISSSLGSSVFAASSGVVTYAGNALSSYGELIVIKHSDNFISTYAHNSKILVKEGQTIKVGEEIAKIGATSDGQSKLYFEIRYQGTPVDPLQFLPK